MIRTKITTWFRQGRFSGAMDVALDYTNLATYSYADDTDGLADFAEDVADARDAVRALRDLAPQHVHPHLDCALREVDCALTQERVLDDRLHRMLNANSAVVRAHRAMEMTS